MKKVYVQPNMKMDRYEVMDIITTSAVVDKVVIDGSGSDVGIITTIQNEQVYSSFFAQ